MKGRINVRVKSISNEVLKRSLAHNYRTRKDLDNVNYEKSYLNTHTHTLKEAKRLLALYQLEHKDVYKETFGERLRPERVNSFLEGIVTFPRKYQQYYEEGKFSKEQLMSYFEEFKKQYEEQSNTQILFSNWHFEESTFHCHFIATNFELKEGRTFKAKGWKSYLQDIGGHAFSPIGLERGIKKEFTRAEHTLRSEHYQKILEQSNELEDILKEGITLEELEDLIKLTEKPLKTMLTYVKRSLQKEKEFDYQLKQQERALNKFSEIFPDVQSVESFNDLLDYIANHQAKTIYKQHKAPEHKGGN